jgi:hypothetical protein
MFLSRLSYISITARPRSPRREHLTAYKVLAVGLRRMSSIAAPIVTVAAAANVRVHRICCNLSELITELKTTTLVH